jgi:hypothetical protein
MPVGGSTAPSTCVVVPETCNGRDDDCDTRIDENPIDLCALQDATATCADGACAVAECASGFVDCNGEASDGCELQADELTCTTCPASCGESDAATPDPIGADSGTDAGSDAGMADAAVPPDPCLALTPSGRGASCDACVCAQCATQIGHCQDHTDATRALRCSDVIDCYFENDVANCGGTSTDSCDDGYDGGNGPCAGELRLAAGGADESDSSAINGGACSAQPADNACAAVSVFATCRDANCMADCM